MMVAGFIKEEIAFIKELKKLSRNMVKDFMSKDVISVDPDATLIEVAEKLDKNKIDRLPVIDSKNRLVGLISRTDLLRALLD
jgi:CBS domain-containing protein